VVAETVHASERRDLSADPTGSPSGRSRA